MKRNTGEPVSFQIGGDRLYGMLHNPPPGVVRRNTGIVILNPGPTDRNGPHRLYLKMASWFSGEGYPVLRFDARGVGESEGEWLGAVEGAPIREVFTKIQEGAWVPDTEGAIEFLMDRAGVRDVVLGGLCGGAITALLAGAEHPNVTGLILIGNPVTLASNTAEVQDLPESVLARDARQYVTKLFRPASWLRLVTLKTDFRTFWAVIRSRLRPRKGERGDNVTGTSRSKLNPRFLRGFTSAIRGHKKLLCVYSENDYLWHEFHEYVSPSLDNGSARQFELVIIPKANHNLTEVEWQAQLRERLLSWIGARSSVPLIVRS